MLDAGGRDGLFPVHELSDLSIQGLLFALLVFIDSGLGLCLVKRVLLVRELEFIEIDLGALDAQEWVDVGRFIDFFPFLLARILDFAQDHRRC